MNEHFDNTRPLRMSCTCHLQEARCAQAENAHVSTRKHTTDAPLLEFMLWQVSYVRIYRRHRRRHARRQLVAHCWQVALFTSSFLGFILQLLRLAPAQLRQRSCVRACYTSVYLTGNSVQLKGDEHADITDCRRTKRYQKSI